MKLTTSARAVLAAALAGGVVSVVPATSAQAADLSATLVAARSTTTGGWAAVPSPDPTGISWDTSRKRLILSDSEVDEMPNLYKGTNVFFSALDGSRLNPGGWTTEPASYEPTGISYQTDSRIFVSDDDADRIFMFNPGGDGSWVSGQDSNPFSFSTRPLHGDAEDVSVDIDTTSGGHVLVVDGVNKAVYDYGTGPNGRFDGPSGDDTVTKLDVGQYGALDPEGVEWYPGRNTVMVLDGKSKTIYELTRSGALLNKISIAAAAPRKAAGMTLAPPSNNPSGPATNFYIVDRGVDNNSDPNENDGRFYEMSVNLPPIPGAVNQPPVVNAGQDTDATTNTAKQLNGSVTDPENLPVTASWSKVSGLGTVSFGSPNAQSTTATFSLAGTYVLRLTGSDGQTTPVSDDVRVTVTDAAQPPPTGGGTLDIRIAAGADDAEQRATKMVLDSSDLDLMVDGTYQQAGVGLRFNGVAVPRGATITNAYVQFQVDEVSTGAANLSIAAQNVADAPAFTATASDITSRPRTSAVTWAPADWSLLNARGSAQQTSDLSSVLQQIVRRGDWASGNSLALIITGSGKRTAESFEGGTAKAPVLHIEYTM